MENNLTYSQIADIPYSQELISLIYPKFANKINKILEYFRFVRLIDLLGVTESEIQRVPNIGKSKIAYFQQLQEYIKNENNWAYIMDVYDCCFKEHLFPENLSEEQQLLPLEDKINLAVRQYADYIVKLSHWHEKVQKDSERIRLIFLEKRTKAEIAKELKIGTERVRQLKTKYVIDFYEGTIKHCSHLRFSDELKAEIKNLIDSMPQYCSSARLCEQLSCDSCEDSTAIILLQASQYSPIKQTPQDSSTIGQQGGQYVYFDQLYYIPRYEDMINLRTYVNTIYKALEGDDDLAEIRPITLDGVMELLPAINPGFDFDRNVVQDILDQHQWIEAITTDDDIKYQVKYQYLKKAYAKVGRLVYEFKRIDLEKIDELHRTKLSDSEAEGVGGNVESAKQHIDWVVSGEYGVVEYNENGEGKQKLTNAVKEYITQHELFAYEDLAQHLIDNGYETTNSTRTIRCYINKLCSPANQAPDIFCRDDVRSLHPEYTWRNKAQNGIGNWVIKATHQYLLEATNNTLEYDKLNEEVKALAKNSPEQYNVSDTWRYIYRHMGEDCIFDSYEDDKGKNYYIKLTSNGLTISPEELDLLSKRNKKPAYYDAVVSKIITLLKDATDCRMRLSDLRKACETDMQDVSTTKFYKIVDNELPEQIEKIEIEGIKYLQFKQEKVVYEQSMTIAAAPQDDSTVMEPIYIEQTVEKQERSFGQVIYMDWNLLQQNLHHELNFYSRFWDLEIDMPTAINKFVNYIQFLPNSRISRHIPRKLLILWNYRSDVYDRKELLNELAICYEELLRQIHYSNTEELIKVNGLVETYSNIPEVLAWRNDIRNNDNNYRKYFEYIRRLRNAIAHGGENSYSTIQLLQHITEYTALYVYTVARFLQ